MMATPRVLTKVAIGTDFFGFSTASMLTAADSSPKKDHKVRAMELPTASLSPRLLGFHEASQVAGLNQCQPMMEMPRTGMMAPQMVMALSLPE